MDTIIGNLQALKEDKPHVIITEEIIKEYIEEYMDELIKEVKEEL